MLTIAVKTKEGNGWVEEVVPDELSERIIMLKTLIGQPSVVDIQTSVSRTFLCGNMDMMKIMTAAHPNGKIIMTAEDAYKMIQYTPDVFCVTIQLFSTPEEAKIMFPDKPKIPEGKGWEHLREET